MIDVNKAKQIDNIPDAFTFNGDYRNHDETFQSMQALDDGTFIFLHNAWNNAIKDDDVYLVHRDSNFNQIGIMKIVAGGHGGSMSAYQDGNTIKIVTTLGLDKTGYPAFIAEFDFQDGRSLTLSDPSLKHLKNYPVGAQPQCAVLGNQKKLIGALEDNWSRYRVYNVDDLNKWVTEMTTSKFVIGSNNIIQSYCIYNDMIFASLGGPGSHISNSDEMQKDPRGLAVVDAIKGETIEKVTLDMKKLNALAINDKVEPEGLTVKDSTLYVAFRTGDNQQARLLIYTFPLDIPQKTPENIKLWDGNPGTLNQVNHDNFSYIQSLIDRVNQLSKTNPLFDSYNVHFDLDLKDFLNRNARVQFLENANKLQEILPKLMADVLFMSGVIDFEYKAPVIPTVLYFDKTVWNNYWSTVAEDLKQLVAGIDQLTGTVTPSEPSTPDDNSGNTNNTPNTPDAPSIPDDSNVTFNCQIKAIDTDKALYHNGDTAQITITFENPDNFAQKAIYTVQANTPTGGVIAVSGSTVTLGAGETQIQTSFKLPNENNVGYLLTVNIKDSNGLTKDTKTSALDVNDSWTSVPRYGVVTNYDATRQTGPDAIVNGINTLKKFHINATMYYDAYYRPQNTIPSDHYQTWIGNNVDKSVVQKGIELNHKFGQSAMLYNMINATTGTPDDNDSAMSNKDLFGSTITRQDGTKGIASKMGVFRTGKCNVCPVPNTFDGLGEQATFNMLGSFNDRDDVDHKVQYYYNPASKDWQDYIGYIMQCSLNYLNFDGWQGDTIGNIYGVPYENKGTNTNGFDTKDTYADFVNNVKPTYMANKTFGMNTVNYDGQNDINNSKADFNYSELWPSNQPTYQDIADCIKQTNSQSDKPLIVPSYLYHDWYKSGDDLPRYFKDEAVLIKDAIIFANGGAPMELANGKELPTEYYPDVEKDRISMTDTLGDPDNGLLRKMYDFVTAYGNLIFRSKFSNQNVIVTIDGTPINSSTADSNKINTITKKTGNVDILQMVNLTGVTDTHWQINNANDEDTKNITPQSDLTVKWYTDKQGTLYGASYEDSQRQELNYTTGNDSIGRYIQFVVDKLNLWNMYYMTA